MWKEKNFWIQQTSTQTFHLFKKEPNKCPHAKKETEIHRWNFQNYKHIPWQLLLVKLGLWPIVVAFPSNTLTPFIQARWNRSTATYPRPNRFSPQRPIPWPECSLGHTVHQHLSSPLLLQSLLVEIGELREQATDRFSQLIITDIGLDGVPQ